MGIICVPGYVNIFMASLESEFKTFEEELTLKENY